MGKACAKWTTPNCWTSPPCHTRSLQICTCLGWWWYCWMSVPRIWCRTWCPLPTASSRCCGCAGWCSSRFSSRPPAIWRCRCCWWLCSPCWWTSSSTKTVTIVWYPTNTDCLNNLRNNHCYQPHHNRRHPHYHSQPHTTKWINHPTNHPPQKRSKCNRTFNTKPTVRHTSHTSHVWNVSSEMRSAGRCHVALFRTGSFIRINANGRVAYV